MEVRRRPTPIIRLVPALARILPGRYGFNSLFPNPILRVVKVQGISMIAGPRTNPDDETEPREGDTLFAYRLFLTDDEYVVGAVLDPRLHNLVHDKVLTGPGTYVRLTDYDVRDSPKKAVTNRFTRFIKVRALEIVYSPGIRFIPEDLDMDGDSPMDGEPQPRTSRTIGKRIKFAEPPHESLDRAEEGEEGEDEMVVIKQERASSSQQTQADNGLDGNRDREVDDEYGLDFDDEDLFQQLENQRGYMTSSAATRNTTPDSFATADERERPASPDYMLDDLDDLTGEEILQLSQTGAPKPEPKVFIKREPMDQTFKSTQKQRIPQEKLRLEGGLRDLMVDLNGNWGCQKAKKKGSQPLFRKEENGRNHGDQVDAGPSNLGGPSSMASTPKKPLHPASPVPRQDRGLSPSSFTNVMIPLASRVPSQEPSTPQRPLKQPMYLGPALFQLPQHRRPLTKLGDLFNKPLGTKVDVLVIIAKIDEQTIKRSIGVKRDMHLLDPTVERTVWLSVWVDAANFKPPVGTCVLFRGLTVHKFDGRSLNAFDDITLTKWHVVEPMEELVPGVDELREWWRQKMIEESLKSFGDIDDGEF